MLVHCSSRCARVCAVCLRLAQAGRLGRFVICVLTPERIRSGQSSTVRVRRARGTPSGTRRARGKLISVFSCNMGTFTTLSPSLAPPRNAKVRPWRPPKAARNPGWVANQRLPGFWLLASRHSLCAYQAPVGPVAKPVHTKPTPLADLCKVRGNGRQLNLRWERCLDLGSSEQS